jgi:hypothetical protein
LKEKIEKKLKLEEKVYEDDKKNYRVREAKKK